MHVQFSGPERHEIISVFGCEQDPEAYPNQGEVAEDDPRYLAFITPMAAAPVDPVEKLKAFLLANPDVAELLA